MSVNIREADRVSKSADRSSTPHRPRRIGADSASYIAIKEFIGRFTLFVLLVAVPIVPVLVLTNCPVAWRVAIPVISLSAYFFLLLLGRDFFDYYIWPSIFVIVVLYAAALLSMALVNELENGVLSPVNQTTSGTNLFNATRPGTILTLFVATITVVGFTITVQRLQEYHVRISHYNRFLTRLAVLLQRTLRDAGHPVSMMDKIEGVYASRASWLRRVVNQEGKEKIRIICSVPTLGNISHHSLYLARVHPLWKLVAECQDIDVEVLCIDGRDSAISNAGCRWNVIAPRTLDQTYLERFDDDTMTSEQREELEKLLGKCSLGLFYREFNLPPEEQAKRLRGLLEAFDVIRMLDERTNGNIVFPYNWHDPKVRPNFHLFWTRSRAIVAVSLDRTVTVAGDKVALIGYETTDGNLIAELLEIYEEFRVKVQENH